MNGPLSADIFLPLLLKSTKKWRLAHNLRKKLKIFFFPLLKRTKNRRLVRFLVKFLEYFFSTNKTDKKMANGSFFMKVFYFFLNKRKEIGKSGCIFTVHDVSIFIKALLF